MNRHRQCKHGLTLIELTVTVALMSLLLSVAAVRLRDPYRIAQTRATIQRLIFLDQQLRTHVRRFGRPAQLTIDMEQGVIERTETRKRTLSTHMAKARLKLGAGIRIDRVLSSSGQAEHGQMTITYVSPGQTVTYAVRLRSADGNAHWVLFTGVAGQVIESDNHKEVDELFASLSAPRSRSAIR